MKKRMSLTVRGKCHEWAVDSDMNQSQIDAMREDEVDLHEIVNSIPMWAVDLGLVRPWCFFQDIFNFRNPFASGDEGGR